MPTTSLIDLEEAIPDTERMLPTVTDALVKLDEVLNTLGVDEVCVLVRIAERLQTGKGVYGPLQIAHDPRAFRSKEAREEIEDALVYLACAWLKAETQEVTR